MIRYRFDIFIIKSFGFFPAKQLGAQDQLVNGQNLCRPSNQRPLFFVFIKTKSHIKILKGKESTRLN